MPKADYEARQQEKKENFGVVTKLKLNITQQVNDLYSAGDIDQIITRNTTYFKMCLLLNLNLGEAIKKLIDLGVRYPEIILSIHEALEQIPKDQITKIDLEALKIIERKLN